LEPTSRLLLLSLHRRRRLAPAPAVIVIPFVVPARVVLSMIAGMVPLDEPAA